MSCGVGHRSGLDPELLYLWCRLEAIAPIPPLAWELPYATPEAIIREKTLKTVNISVDKDVEQLELSYIPNGNVKILQPLWENSLTIYYTVKNFLP